MRNNEEQDEKETTLIINYDLYYTEYSEEELSRSYLW